MFVVCRIKPSSSGPRPVEAGRPLGPDDGGCGRPGHAACLLPSPPGSAARLSVPLRLPTLPVMPESEGSSAHAVRQLTPRTARPHHTRSATVAGRRSTPDRLATTVRHIAGRRSAARTGRDTTAARAARRRC